MHSYDEGNVPLTGVIRNMHKVCNRGLLKASYAKQHWEGFLQGNISHLKSYKSEEIHKLSYLASTPALHNASLFVV